MAPVSTPFGGRTTSEETTGRPAWAWVILVVIVAVALAIPFLRQPTLLADDFSSLRVLHDWMDNVTTATYGDGVYLLTTYGTDAGSGAIHELPRSVDGMTIEIHATVEDGMAAVGVECITEMRQVDPVGSPWLYETTGYTFVVGPTADRYAIVDGTGDVLHEGALTGDPSEGLAFDCIADDSGTILRIRAGRGEPSEFVHEEGGDPFQAISLNALQLGRREGTVAFEDVRVTEATAEDST